MEINEFWFVWREMVIQLFECFVYVCVICICACVYRGWGIPGILLYSLFIPFRQGLSLNQELAVLARLAVQWAPRIHKSLPLTALRLQVDHSHTKLFTWVLGKYSSLQSHLLSPLPKPDNSVSKNRSCTSQLYLLLQIKGINVHQTNHLLRK